VKIAVFGKCPANLEFIRAAAHFHDKRTVSCTGISKILLEGNVEDMKSFDEVTRATQRKRLRHLGEMALQR
jgi:hypothetical protein